MANIDLRNPAGSGVNILLSDPAAAPNFFFLQAIPIDDYDEVIDTYNQLQIHDVVAADPDWWQQQEINDGIDDAIGQLYQSQEPDPVVVLDDFWIVDVIPDQLVDDVTYLYQIPFLEEPVPFWIPHPEFSDDIPLEQYQDSGVVYEEIPFDAGPDNDNWGSLEFDYDIDTYSGEDVNQSFFIPTIPAPTFGTKHALARLYLLEARLDVRLETDEGTVSALASDSGGTTVNFNKDFKDIISINVSVLDTVEKKAIFDFTDVPDPTSFKVLVFDTAGARVNATVHWIARGVL